MNKLLLLLSCIPSLFFAQISITSSGSYTENFDVLANTGTANTWTDNSTIPNFFAQRTGFGTTYQAGTGSSIVGNLYSFGSSGSTDRALGSLGSDNTSALDFAYGILIQNNSGFVLNDLSVSYTLEQWRNAGNTSPDEITFWYKISDAPISSLTPTNTNGWTPVTVLNSSSPINTITAGALDGNLSANRLVISAVQIPLLQVPEGSYLMLKWEDINHPGNDDGLGIDDLQLTWNTGCNTSNILTEVACNSYTVPSGQETYFVSGVYYDTIPNAGLCDSLLTINLTVQAGTTYYADSDFDGLGDVNVSVNTCIIPVGFVTNSLDCNDQLSAIGGASTEFYLDADLDGFGDPTQPIISCTLPTGYSANSLDCNDADSGINPNAFDIPDNGIDEDCSGTDASAIGSNLGIYEFTQAAACPVTAVDVTTQPANAMFSNYQSVGNSCSASTNVYNTNAWNTTSVLNPDEYNGFTISADSCFSLEINQFIFTHRISAAGGTPTWILKSSLDNFDAILASGTPTSVDQIDTIQLPTDFDQLATVTFRLYLINMGTGVATWRNDNVTLVGNIHPITPTSFYLDNDLDGYGDPATVVVACSAPQGYVSNSADCNDANSGINPMTIWYQDVDNDNLGNANMIFTGCNPPANYVLVSGDCDDFSSQIGLPTAYYVDQDHDGYGTGAPTNFCINPGLGYALNNLDCNDSLVEIYPGNTEICDGLDNDCDGLVDDSLLFTAYYVDADSDNFGSGDPVYFCQTPDIGLGFVSQTGDCNDSNPTIFPGAIEILNNGIDENCDFTDNYLSIEEHSFQQAVIVPNPSNGIFDLRFPEMNETYFVTLLTLTGEIIDTKILSEKLVTLDFSYLSAGMYVLQLHSNSAQRILKFSIVH